MILGCPFSGKTSSADNSNDWPHKMATAISKEDPHCAIIVVNWKQGASPLKAIRKRFSKYKCVKVYERVNQFRLMWEISPLPPQKKIKLRNNKYGNT